MSLTFFKKPVSYFVESHNLGYLVFPHDLHVFGMYITEVMLCFSQYPIRKHKTLIYPITVV